MAEEMGTAAPTTETADTDQNTNPVSNEAGKSHFTRSWQRADSALADLIDFFEACGFGGQCGWLAIRWGREPYLDKNGNYKHGDSAEFAVRWPDEAEETLPLILEMADDGDVYVCPYLRRTEGQRKKGDAVALWLVHCDVDVQVDPALVQNLGGFAITSGTPGHAHVYLPLARPVTLAQHEALARPLIKHLGADKGKWSDNDVLRPPGTFNYKPTVFDNLPPAPVTWLVRP